jgi:uncharacterized protein (DUF1800 family)
VEAASLHLLRRATYGPTPASMAQISRLGAQGWLDRQLRPASIADARCTALLTRFPQSTWSPQKIRAHYVDAFGDWTPMLHLTRATIARAIWSERQLLEVMTEFWSNHLNVTCPSSDVWDNRPSYDRQVIRAHALGSFSDLLVAASTHPAMLAYLNNASSTKERPNENQGREVMELHTVGVGAGYGEDDVRDSARILTGLTIDDAGGFQYRAEWHHTGPISVLGFSAANASAAGGQQVAHNYLRYLAMHPATARRIATKLVIRFVSDDPPAKLVAALAKAYLAGKTQIVPVLRLLFRSREFAASAGDKVRRPYEDLVATVRTLGLQPDMRGEAAIEALHWTLAGMGQSPLGWNQPDGYPDVARSWQSAAGTLARWNSHLNIAARWWPSTLTGPPLSHLLPDPLPKTYGQLLDSLGKRLVQRALPTAGKIAICAFLSDQYTTISPASRVTRSSAIVGWRLPYVVALILDSPWHAVR